LCMEGDQYPAYYKCNSENRLDKILLPLGFHKEYVLYYSNLIMLENFLSYALSLIWDYITNIKFLNIFKTGLIACYRKN